MFPSSWKKYPFPGRSNRDTRTHNYSTCRQVKISFLGMPHIAHSQVEKWKSSLPWEGGHPPPTPSPPARSLRSLGLGRFAPSQRLCPPNVLAHYATAFMSSVIELNFFFFLHVLMKNKFTYSVSKYQSFWCSGFQWMSLWRSDKFLLTLSLFRHLQVSHTWHLYLLHQSS